MNRTPPRLQSFGHLRQDPRTGNALVAIQLVKTDIDIGPQPIQARSLRFIRREQQPQAFPNDLAGIVVQTRSHLFGDPFLQLRRERDVHRGISDRMR